MHQHHDHRNQQAVFSQAAADQRDRGLGIDHAGRRGKNQAAPGGAHLRQVVEGQISSQDPQKRPVHRVGADLAKQGKSPAAAKRQHLPQPAQTLPHDRQRDQVQGAVIYGRIQAGKIGRLLPGKAQSQMHIARAEQCPQNIAQNHDQKDLHKSLGPRPGRIKHHRQQQEKSAHQSIPPAVFFLRKDLRKKPCQQNSVDQKIDAAVRIRNPRYHKRTPAKPAKLSKNSFRRCLLRGISSPLVIVTLLAWI